MKTKRTFIPLIRKRQVKTVSNENMQIVDRTGIVRDNVMTNLIKGKKFCKAMIAYVLGGFGT